ncbi:MAG: hypothetical protein E7163_02770 [Firmicutes bacterium]|nr:hypothetical protein [Bacillota bacterium]
MKKLLILVGFVVISLLPVVVKADSVSFVQKGNAYVTEKDISGGIYGTFKAGDITYEYTDATNGLKEWNFYLTAGSDLNNIYIALQPIKLEIQKVKEGSEFVKESQTKDTDGSTVILLRSGDGVKKGERVLLFTVTTKDDRDATGCQLNIVPKKIACLELESSYFDDNGNEVSKEEYDKVCSNVGPTDEPLEDVPNNSQTGIPVPYIALGGGLIALAGVYFLNKKNTKMFKL